MNGDKKLIYFLVALIIFFAIVLLVKIETMPQYDFNIYEDIYDEYSNIFGEDNNWNSIQNLQSNDSIIKETNNQTTITGTTSSNIEQGNVIGKIMIPKIQIQYPIIKETTTEYLKVAPTKYCGPGVNEIRKFSNNRA